MVGTDVVVLIEFGGPWVPAALSGLLGVDQVVGEMLVQLPQLRRRP